MMASSFWCMEIFSFPLIDPTIGVPAICFGTESADLPALTIVTVVYVS